MQSRMLGCFLLLAGTVLLGSCGGGVGIAPVTVSPVRALDVPLYATGSASAPSFSGAIRISNRASTASQVGISIARQLFGNEDDMLAYIAALPPMFDGEPDYRKAWRFLTARAYFYTPFTGSNDVHDPLMFVNSLGYGYCDDFANVLATIWQWKGYESRVWWLSGHVVPEILVNDRRMMFDADFGVFYTDGAGEVASVEELAADPALITQPVDAMYDSSYVAYEPLIADIYAQHRQ